MKSKIGKWSSEGFLKEGFYRVTAEPGEIFDEMLTLLMDIHTTISDDKLRERVGCCIVKAKGE